MCPPGLRCRMKRDPPGEQTDSLLPHCQVCVHMCMCLHESWVEGQVELCFNIQKSVVKGDASIGLKTRL